MNVFFSEKKLIYLCWKQLNSFQYTFVVTSLFLLIIISETVLQIITTKRKCKWNIFVENILTNNCNIMLDTMS